MRKRIKRRDLERITNEFQKQTAGLSDQWALDSLGAESFLPLLSLADYAKMGKTRAILISFKLGYMEGKKDILKKIEGHLNNTI